MTLLTVATVATLTLCLLTAALALYWLTLHTLTAINRAANIWLRLGLSILHTEGLDAMREFEASPPWYVRLVCNEFRR